MQHTPSSHKALVFFVGRLLDGVPAAASHSQCAGQCQSQAMAVQLSSNEAAWRLSRAARGEVACSACSPVC